MVGDGDGGAGMGGIRLLASTNQHAMGMATKKSAAHGVERPITWRVVKIKPKSRIPLLRIELVLEERKKLFA